MGYRESLMEVRINAMPLADDVKELIRHALVWIWKDEEMHTIYIRGAILKLGGWRSANRGFFDSGSGRDRRLGCVRSCSTAVGNERPLSRSW